MKENKYNLPVLGVDEIVYRINEYIVPELRRPCKNLWNKNIFTLMCSNHDDYRDVHKLQPVSYIIIKEDDLSSENSGIFFNLSGEYSEFTIDEDRNFNIIQLDGIGKPVESKFLSLIKFFKLQDVQPKYYLTEEEFLIHCGCSTTFKNMDEKDLTYLSYFRKKYSNYWKYDYISLDEIKLFDETKVEKPTEDYLKEHKLLHLYDKDSKKIFESEFYLNAHKKYKELTQNPDSGSSPV